MASNCSVNILISLLGKRWTFPIIHSLKKNKQLSFNQIMKLSKNKINPRALALSLKQLTSFGIITKEKKESQISYSLTENGERISHLIKSFKSWCHINDMGPPTTCNLDCLSCKHH